MFNMNEFKKSLRSEKKVTHERKIKSKPQTWQFYKTYKKGKNGNKIYQKKYQQRVN